MGTVLGRVGSRKGRHGRDVLLVGRGTTLAISVFVSEAVRLTRLRQLNVLPEDEDDLPMESERAGLFFDAVGMGPSDEE
jgi:hypothetical protein